MHLKFYNPISLNKGEFMAKRTTSEPKDDLDYFAPKDFMNRLIARLDGSWICIVENKIVDKKY